MIRVIEPGPLTTVQDLGRYGVAHLGVPRAGAVDALSLQLANRLTGNRADAAALEMTVAGATLAFETDTVIALTGAAIEARLDGQFIGMGQTIPVRRGQTLALGAIRAGMRTYLAVEGGIRVPRVLGSRSTDTLAGLGPAPLRAGDRLPIASSGHYRPRYLRAAPDLGLDKPLRFIFGPHAERFTDAARRAITEEAFRVSSESDRTGIRLKGAKLQRQQAGELPSSGMVGGAIQVPPDGQPILLLANHAPTGGYPVIGVVIGADLPRAAQARLGESLRLRAVDPDEALAALRAQAHFVQEAVVDAKDPALLQIRELIQLAGRDPALRELALRDGARAIRIRR